MPIAQIAPGRAMLVSTGVPALWQPLAVAVTPGYATPTPTSIPGCIGWWDAGFLAHALDDRGVPLSSWGSLASAVADQSPSNVPLSIYHFADTGTSPQATPRLSGTLGGLGNSLVTPPAMPPNGGPLPQLDADTGLALPFASMGSGTPWTAYLVWSRPNLPPPANASSIVLMALGGVPFLGATPTSLLLYPGGSQVAIASSLDRRHTHAVMIRNTPGVGVDVWLDGVQMVMAHTNPTASNASGELLFLHSGQSNGSAQCWYHEAAIFNRSLDGADIATMNAYAARWTLGARKGIQLFVLGQSNAVNGLNAGAWHLLAQGAAYYTGALAYGVLAADQSVHPTAYTMRGGAGISNAPFTGTVVWAGSFLNDPEDGSDPATWSLGADGNAVEAYLAEQSVADLSDIALMVWPWSETESSYARSYGDEPFVLAAKKNFAGKMRAYLGRTPENLPWMLWNAIPFGSGSVGAIQMDREVDQMIAADTTQGAFIGWPQTADTNPGGTFTWDPTTGEWSNGTNPDYNHRAIADLLMLGRRGAVTAGNAILAAGGGDAFTAYPPSIPTIGGPYISRVVQTTAHSTTLVLTITHDAGNDLIVPLLAQSGQGFSIIDGGTAAAPVALILAIACSRIDATHLQLTLASAPTNTQSGLLLCYPTGYDNIFRGDAVTDNFASLSPPPGWDIAGDLGSAWSQNYPLAAANGLPVFSTP